jgi:signal transduction histidine kinase
MARTKDQLRGTEPVDDSDGARDRREHELFLLNLGHSVRTPAAPVYLQLRRIVRHAVETPGVVQDPDWLVPRLVELSERFEAYLRRVDQMCDLAVAISGGRPPAPEWLDLSAQVREAAAGLARERAAAGVELAVEGTNEPIEGHWDRARLQGLIGHLLSSSVRFGSGHPVTVSVRADDARVQVTLAFGRRDALKADADAILEEVGKREADAGNLCGGIWAVRYLAASMGGTVLARGDPGVGLSFVVTLPRREV